VLGVTAYALGTVFDRFVITVFEVSVLDYLLLVQTFVLVNSVLFLFLIGRGISVFKKGFVLGGKWIFLIAVLAILHRFFYLEASARGSVGLVVAVKRSSVVWATLAGYYFGEKAVFRKSIAAMVILFGLIILLVWS
jgi:uncharacterized membrane protein